MKEQEDEDQMFKACLDGRIYKFFDNDACLIAYGIYENLGCYEALEARLGDLGICFMCCGGDGGG